MKLLSDLLQHLFGLQSTFLQVNGKCYVLYKTFKYICFTLKKNIGVTISWQVVFCVIFIWNTAVFMNTANFHTKNCWFSWKSAVFSVKIGGFHCFHYGFHEKTVILGLKLERNTPDKDLSNNFYFSFTTHTYMHHTYICAPHTQMCTTSTINK